jgi:hypothetical protein
MTGSITAIGQSTTYSDKKKNFIQYIVDVLLMKTLAFVFKLNELASQVDKAL